MPCVNNITSLFLLVCFTSDAYNPLQNIWYRFTNLNEIQLFLKKSIADLFEFCGAIARFSFHQGRLGTRLSAVNLEILLKLPNFFPNIIRSQVLSCLATHKETRTFSFY